MLDPVTKLTQKRLREPSGNLIPASSHVKKSAHAVLFDGIGDNVYRDAYSWSGGRRLRGWFKTTGTSTCVLYKAYDHIAPFTGWGVQLENGSSLRVWDGATWHSGTGTWNDGVWHYVDVLIDGTSLTVTMDGSSILNVTCAAVANYTGAAMSIGANRQAGSAYFPGMMAGIELYDGDTLISAPFFGGRAAGTISGVSLFDQSGNGRTWTTDGCTAVVGVEEGENTPTQTALIDFNFGQYYNGSSMETFGDINDPKTSDFEIAFSLIPENLSTNQTLVSKKVGVVTDTDAGYIVYLENNGSIRANITNGSSRLTAVGSVLALGIPYKIRVVYDRDGDLTIYVNEVADATANISSMSGDNITNVAQFSLGGNTSGFYLTGILTEPKYNGVLQEKIYSVPSVILPSQISDSTLDIFGSSIKHSRNGRYNATGFGDLVEVADSAALDDVQAFAAWVRYTGADVEIVELASGISIDIAAGVVTTTGLTGVTVYVDLVSTTAIAEGVWLVVVNFDTINAGPIKIAQEVQSSRGFAYADPTTSSTRTQLKRATERTYGRV